MHPEISVKWLLMGEGSMLKTDTYNNVSPESLSEKPKRLIPFYDDVVSFGGINEYSANMEGVSRPAEYIDAGDWFSEATAAIRHYGDSMDEYPPGCILALKEVHKIDLVVWGRNYMIETDEFRITKCLQKGGSPNYVCAYSTNKETYPDGRLKHEPIDIPKAEIRKLALVLGCVIKHSSSGVVYINDKNNKEKD
jgi:hypothetical protein